MALDRFGNYIANIEPPEAPYPPSSRCCRSGTGAPDDADGSNGQTYIDLSNSDIYTRANGTWTLVGDSGSGLVQLGVVDPEGVVTAVEGKAYLNTALQTFWVKNSGVGNTGWGPNLI